MNLRTNDPLQKAFSSQRCATKAYLFSNVVCGLAQRFTSNVKKKSESNSNFFDVNLPKERSVQKIILFPVLHERLLIFKYDNWAQAVLLSKYKFNSENIMYRV